MPVLLVFFCFVRSEKVLDGENQAYITSEELGTCGSGRVAAPGLPRADFLTSCRVLLRRVVGAAGRRGRRAGAWASRSFPGPACAVPAQSASPPRARLSRGPFPHFHPLKAASNKNELSPRQS